MIDFDVDMGYLLECDELDKVVLNDESGEHESMEFVPRDAATVGAVPETKYLMVLDEAREAQRKLEMRQTSQKVYQSKCRSLKETNADLRRIIQEMKAETVGCSCTSCPEMDNPDSYISHLQSALKWHDEHVPRPTNPRNTCVVLKGEKPPEEVLFVHDEGGVTHYLPEDETVGTGTCRTVYLVEVSDDLIESWHPTGVYLHRESAEDRAKALRREKDGILQFVRVVELGMEGAETCIYVPDEMGFTWWDENDVEHYEEHSASDECCSASCDKCGNQMMVGDDGWFNGWDEITEWWEEDGSYHKGYVLEPRFKHCPNCGRKL